MQTIKRILKNAQSSGKDPYISVLEYRTTPLSSGYSPAQLLMSRRLRSVLPCLQSQLIPNTPDVVKITNHMKLNHTPQKKYDHTDAKQLKPLNHNETVKLQHHINKIWKPAVVVQKHDQRSYLVRTEDGAEYRRNCRHLLNANEKSLNQNQFDSFPNVLDQQNLDELNSVPKLRNSEYPIQSKSPIKVSNDGPYITRSGRVVKPKTVVSM